MLLRRYHKAVETTEEAAEVKDTPYKANDPATPAVPTVPADEAPAGNASKADWEAYALTQGRAPEELDGLTRDQLRDLFN